MSFRLGTNFRYKSKDDQWIEDVTWNSVSFFGSKADTFMRFFKKGRRILIDGSLRTDTWKDEEGKDHVRDYIRGMDWFFMDSKQGQGTGDAYKAPQASDTFDPSSAGDFTGIDATPF